MEITKYTAHLDAKRRPILYPEIVGEWDEEVPDPEAVRNMLNTLFDMQNLADEFLYCIALGTRLNVLGIFEVGHGGINSAPVPIASLFRNALLLGADRIILAHNHPSGNPQPSKEDIGLTDNIIKAGKLIRVGLVDHIIIGTDGYYSLARVGATAHRCRDERDRGRGTAAHG